MYINFYINVPHPRIEISGRNVKETKRPVGAKRLGAKRPGANRPGGGGGGGGGGGAKGGNVFGAKRSGTLKLFLISPNQ